jgi:hypothetical protein
MSEMTTATAMATLIAIVFDFEVAVAAEQTNIFANVYHSKFYFEIGFSNTIYNINGNTHRI